MLKSSDLLVKFARLIGIQESKARYGFENFVIHFTQKYPLGTKIKVNSLGYFSYKKIAATSSTNSELQSVIIFSENPLNSSSDNILVFFAPDQINQNYSLLDSYLNLSFGNYQLILDKKTNNEFVKSYSLNEKRSLIESKIEKLFSNSVEIQKGEESEEFILPSKDQALVSGELINNEYASFREKESEIDGKDLVSSTKMDEDLSGKEIESFELVDPSDVKKSDDGIDVKNDNNKWVFDDLAIETELNVPAKSEEVRNGFTEVKSQIPESFKENNEKTISRSVDQQLEKSEEKLKRRKIRRVLFRTIIVLILAASALGVYLNFDQINELISQYSGNKQELVVVREKVIPNIIERDPSLIFTEFYISDLELPNSIVDSMIISPKVYDMTNMISDNLNGEMYEGN